MNQHKKQNTFRFSDANPIAEVLQQVIQTNNLEKGLDQMEIIDIWKNLMGNGVWSYTEKIVFKAGTLTVKISSPALRTELNYGKEKIVTMINEALGKQIVNKVVLS